MSTEYEDLAERAERGDLTVKPGTIRRGDAMRADVRHALMDATGASTPQEAARLAIGRPPAGMNNGPSPVIRARVPQTLKDSLATLAEQEHRPESDIIREAVANYLSLRRAS